MLLSLIIFHASRSPYWRTGSPGCLKEKPPFAVYLYQSPTFCFPVSLKRCTVVRAATAKTVSEAESLNRCMILPCLPRERNSQELPANKYEEMSWAISYEKAEKTNQSSLSNLSWTAAMMMDIDEILQDLFDTISSYLISTTYRHASACKKESSGSFIQLGTWQMIVACCEYT